MIGSKTQRRSGKKLTRAHSQSHNAETGSETQGKKEKRAKNFSFLEVWSGKHLDSRQKIPRVCFSREQRTSLSRKTCYPSLKVDQVQRVWRKEASEALPQCKLRLLVRCTEGCWAPGPTDSSLCGETLRHPGSNQGFFPFLHLF